MEVELTIFMEPVGRGRTKSTRPKRGVRTIHYTPEKTAHAQNLIRDELMKLKLRFEAKLPIRLILSFFLSRPKSIPKKQEFPISRPDWDNLAGLVTDSMEKFVYPNDSQITTATIQKRYIKPGQVPRIHIYLAEDKGE